MPIIHVSEENFEQEVLHAPQPVLVDFWATWCAPCKLLSPIFEEAAAQYGDRCKFVKIDTDANRALSLRCGVAGVPTLLLFRDGQAVKRSVGLITLEEMLALIE